METISTRLLTVSTRPSCPDFFRLQAYLEELNRLAKDTA